MPTITENDPIDGAELKRIILSRISTALDKDCTLTDDIAYAGFSLHFEIKLKFLRSKTADTLIWGVEPGLGISEGPELQKVLVETVSDTYTTDSPNTAREEHNLPIPVIVQTPSGPERRKIHVNRKGAGDAKNSQS